VQLLALAQHYSKFIPKTLNIFHTPTASVNKSLLLFSLIFAREDYRKYSFFTKNSEFISLSVIALVGLNKNKIFLGFIWRLWDLGGSRSTFVCWTGDWKKEGLVCKRAASVERETLLATRNRLRSESVRAESASGPPSIGLTSSPPYFPLTLHYLYSMETTPSSSPTGLAILNSALILITEILWLHLAFLSCSLYSQTLIALPPYKNLIFPIKK
jgi:hypothetical protein